MPGLRQSDGDKSVDFIDDILSDEFADDIEDEEEEQKASSRNSKSNGEYFRKIEMLMEQKRLKENLSDYDWDDI